MNNQQSNSHLNRTQILWFSAPGCPTLVQEIAHIFEQTGIPCQLDASRGFEHGLFIPLLMMYL